MGERFGTVVTILSFNEQTINKKGSLTSSSSFRLVSCNDAKKSKQMKGRGTEDGR